MNREKIIETILKLRAHEQSARKTNALEADAFRAKAENLMSKHSINETDLTMPEIVSGKWKCSCGAQISLIFSAGQLSDDFIESLFAPHRKRGHRLTRKA